MIKIAICQVKAVTDRDETLNHACDMIREAASNGADFAVLPEMFICPYSPRWFRRCAELGHEPIVSALSDLAKDLGIYIVGGSIPESAAGKIYNTCFIFDRQGNIIGRHRKIHLFDSDVSGMPVRESDTFSPGSEITVFDTEFGKMGCAVCYDIRFPEVFRAMAERGAQVVFLPAQFNMVSGPHHWASMLRARACDYQYFFVGAAAARNPDFKYQCYGHSIIIDPFGDVLGIGDEDETIVYADIDLGRIEEVREMLPCKKNIRRDIYCVAE